MLVVVGGFSVSGVGGSATGPSVPYDSITIDERMNDPLPTATFDILDPGSQATYTIGMECTIWDENAPPQGTTPTVPAHNLLGKAVYFLDTVYWVQQGVLGGTISRSTTTFSLTFSNNTSGSQGYLAQQTQLGYCHPGQTYMLSAYLTINSALTNANMFLQMQFLNATNQQIGPSVSFTRSGITNNVRESIKATAPANAVYIQVFLGGQTTANTNSGTGQWGTPQLEPMWFTNEGITYPTPDCNFNQSNCARCADDTISRACRLFAGYIHDLQITYDGPNRTWHVSCIGPGAVLDNSLVSHAGGTFSDSQIINDTITAYFTYTNPSTGPNYTLISNVAVNAFAPTPVQTIASSVTGQWTDISFRSMLNDLVGISGGQYYLDWYYNLYYQPIYNQTANFSLTDTPGYATVAVEYSFARSITLLHSQVKGGQNLYNFPVLISFTDTTLKTLANGGRVQNSNGYDIIFMDATQTIQLAHELESYNGTTGAIVAWVNVPTLSASTDTTIVMFYGNASVTSPTATPILVWDSQFTSIYHMNDNAANKNVVDSSPYGRTATSQANTSTKSTAGEIDSALSFNGTSDFISLPGDYADFTAGLTLSIWANPSAATSYARFFELGNGQGSDNIVFGRLQTGTSLIYEVWKGGTLLSIITASSAIALNTWQHFAVTADLGGNVTIYKNGAAIATGSSPVPTNILRGVNYLGQSSFGGVSLFQGTLDEARISTTIRSPGWIATEYANQSNPGGFISLGGVTQIIDPQVDERAYAYYNYKLQYDGTQIKNQVKVVGSSSANVASVIGANINQPLAPPYVTPPFQALVTDSNLTSVAAATSRGLAELAQYENPRTLIKLTTQHYTPAGTVIQLTSQLDGITKQGFVVQAVKGKCLGNGINEFEYDLGAYNPTIIDHLRKLTKTVSQPTQTTTTTPGATDLAFYEQLFFGEQAITFTPQ